MMLPAPPGLDLRAARCGSRPSYQRRRANARLQDLEAEREKKRAEV
jgi:hypothetical protein